VEYRRVWSKYDLLATTLRVAQLMPPKIGLVAALYLSIQIVSMDSDLKR
jgi:hypothetical protein